MNLDALLKLLELETPDELVYFEQFAELTEEPQDIPVETLTELAAAMEPDVLSELVGGYFEDLLKFVPDDEDDLYTLLSNIGTTLSSLAEGREDDSARSFAEELYKFRTWYLFDSRVQCTDLSEGVEREVTLIEALTNYRVQSFTDNEYTFDFSAALDYPLEEYIVSLGSLMEDDYGDGNYEDDGEHYDRDEDGLNYYDPREEADSLGYYDPMEDSDSLGYYGPEEDEDDMDLYDPEEKDDGIDAILN